MLTVLGVSIFFKSTIFTTLNFCFELSERQGSRKSIVSGANEDDVRRRGCMRGFCGESGTAEGGKGPTEIDSLRDK